MPTTTPSTLFLSLTAALTTAACINSIEENPLHCSNNAGDEYCALVFPEFPVCSDGSREECTLVNRERRRYGCTTEEELIPGCHDPCGDDNPECDTAGTMTASTGPTTAPSSTDPTMGPGPTSDTETSGTETETTDDPGCESSDDCMDADAPFCADDGTCVTCDAIPESDAACTELDPGAPVCNDGQCVQCTDDNPAACDGQTPVCNPDNACVACTEHSQCPDSACHLDGADVGGCFDEGDVVTANTAAALVAAVSGLGAGDDLVVELSATVDYNQTVNINADAEVALLGPSSAELTGTGGLPSLNVAGSAVVYLAGPSVASGDTGVDCSGTSIWLDDAEVRNNAQVGLDISGGCAAHLRRTVVRANAGGGVEASGATSVLAMVNSLVVDNVGATAGPGVRVTSADVAMSYSVVAGNGTIANPDNIECLSGATGYARNSIVSGQNGNSIVTCGGLTWDNNAVDTSALGGSNDNVGMYDSSWFADPGTGDYRLTTAGESEFMDIAEWQDGDPLTDIDGQPIPTDMPSFPGYHQP